jgi:hypothetical protein
MAILTKEQLDKIREIIQRHVSWFIWRLFGDKFAESDPSQVAVPKYIQDQLPTSLTKLSFVLGREEALMKESEWKSYSWDSLEQAAAKKLTPVEELQVQAADLAAYSKYRQLGEDIANGIFEKLAQQTNQAVSEGQVRGIIQDKIKFGTETTRRYSDVANDLRDALQENKRNWERVASTEMHQARQQGVVHAIVNKLDFYEDSAGADSLVAVVPAPDACSDCDRLYLSQSGTPKIFKLSELLANAGTNYQRPWRDNAMPVVPPLHPHCFCRLRYVPPGWGWNKDGRFTLIDPKSAFPKVEKSEPLTKGIDQNAHSLLHASNATFPTREYLAQVEDPKELEHIERRLKKLEQLYINDPDLHKRVSDLLHYVRGRHFHMHMMGQVSPEEGSNG